MNIILSHSFPCGVLLCVAFVILVTIVASDDYYELLGVSKDADGREIRKAFKKLALKYHPDKNKEDQEIYELFVKISRAYEILKDEDSRRKYDLHGDEGLANEFQSRGESQYRSWSYYENFGIYDDDPEIITLSKADFERSVLGASDMWFINFYSPMCSHCHQLAPAWREMARELHGVLRIGAVNCEEEWMLCRQQGIQSYPSLMLYPNKEKYYGDRTTSNLVEHVLRTIPSKLLHLNEANVGQYLANPKYERLAWLVFFCDVISDCPSPKTQLKISAIMENLVNVATVDVFGEPKFSGTLHSGTGVAFFHPGKLLEKSAIEILSLDAHEITKEALKYLPNVSALAANSLKDLKSHLEEADDPPALLLCFMQNADILDIELRKLPFLLDEVEVKMVDCNSQADLCGEFYVHKYPTFIVFKADGRHEVHHDRTTAKDIAAFVRESLSSEVQSLTPEDFNSRILNGDKPWFVDFFAPWCPPCLHLLPEWREASRKVDGVVSFGTVDCTVHRDLCNSHDIRSFPTTILYNRSVPHPYYGQRTAPELIEFIQDFLSPPVLSLTFATFYDLVFEKSTSEIWVVDFYAPWCGPCQQLAPQFRKMSKLLSDVAGVRVARVDCTMHSKVCDSEGVHSYPTIRLYPRDSTRNSNFVTYSGFDRNANSLKAWVLQFLPSRVIELDNNAFYNRIIYNTEPWLIYFYAPWCGHCQMFTPEYETIAHNLSGRLKTGKVNCDITQYVCQQAGIRGYPTVKFYPGSSSMKTPQNTFGRDIHSQEKSAIISYVQSWLEQSEVLYNHDEL